MTFRQNPSIEGLHKIVQEKHLPETHGARRFFHFNEHGQGSVRNFVRQLGMSVEQPYLDDFQGVDQWLAMMDALFKNMPSNLNAIMTIGWVTRRFIARGLTDAVVKESLAHGGDIPTEVAGIVRREGGSTKKSKGHGGMQGGVGFTYQPNTP